MIQSHSADYADIDDARYAVEILRHHGFATTGPDPTVGADDDDVIWVVDCWEVDYSDHPTTRLTAVANTELDEHDRGRSTIWDEQDERDYE